MSNKNSIDLRTSVLTGKVNIPVVPWLLPSSLRPRISPRILRRRNMTDPVTITGFVIGTGTSVTLYSKWQYDQMNQTDVWGWIRDPDIEFDESQTIKSYWSSWNQRITSEVGKSWSLFQRTIVLYSLSRTRPLPSWLKVFPWECKVVSRTWSWRPGVRRGPRIHSRQTFEFFLAIVRTQMPT